MLGRGIAICVLILCAFRGVSLGSDGPVEISLLGVIQPAGEIVTIADVARISSGDLITRRQIAGLDIAELGGERPPRSVSKKQIVLRILLAGISPHDFQVAGAEKVLFKKGQAQSSEKKILEFLRPSIAGRLGVDPADVQIRLTRPLVVDPSDLFRPGVRLEHFLPPTIRLGMVNASIGIHEGDRLIRTMSVSLQVQLAREVYVAQRPLESGTTISADDVIKERRILSSPVTNYATSDIVGKRTRKAIQPGAVLTENDLQRPAPPRKEIVVRTRDIVEVVARRRGLQVRISGAVALQQGAIGDAIRVKNPNSGRNGRVLTAKVVDAGVVEIRL